MIEYRAKQEGDFSDALHASESDSTSSGKESPVFKQGEELPQKFTYLGAVHFFAQLSNSELKTRTQMRKYHALRMLKQANGAKK